MIELGRKPHMVSRHTATRTIVTSTARNCQPCYFSIYLRPPTFNDVGTGGVKSAAPSAVESSSHRNCLKRAGKDIKGEAK